MIRTFDGVSVPTPHDVCIVGAGPVGIALAIACEAHGLRTLVLESGQREPTVDAASLSNGHVVVPERHADPEVAICRALGGTSRWWGGRCVPFDPLDFDTRLEDGHPAWPVSYAECSEWYDAAARFLGIATGPFSNESKDCRLDGVRFDELERWTPDTNMGHKYLALLEKSQSITVWLGATVTALRLSDDQSRLSGLEIHGTAGTLSFDTPMVCLSGGGIETTRLLLVARQRYPEKFGGMSGALGRYYMGHLSGKISQLALNDPTRLTEHAFFLEGTSYARRRYTVSADVRLRERLPNIAFWADNAPFHDHRHGSGTLSAVWAMLAIPPVGRRLVSEGVRRSHVGQSRQWLPHVLNICRSPAATLLDLFRIAKARKIDKPRRPGFLLHDRRATYALHFHAEQTPSRQSMMKLSDRCDRLGIPFLDVDIRFERSDAEGVVRAHRLLDNSLRAGNQGRLIFAATSTEDLVDQVLDQAADGFHQIGTTRMSRAPEDGVVDKDCKIHDLANVFVVSSSVFPTSGQANPTFLAVALALRLAEHLQRSSRSFAMAA